MCTPEFHISGYSTCIYYQRHSKQGNQLMLSVVACLYIRIHTYIQHLVQITIMWQASDKRLKLCESEAKQSEKRAKLEKKKKAVDKELSKEAK